MASAKHSATSAAIILIATSLAGNIIGILREVLIARSFGASAGYDAFVISQYIPSLVYAMFFFGIQNIYTPWYYRVRERDGLDRATDFERNFFWAWLIVAFGLCIAVAAGAHVLTSKLGESMDLKSRSEIAGMMRILMAGIYCGIIFVLLRSILTTHRYFVAASVAPILYNVAIVSAIVIGSSAFSVRALVYGSVAGMALQLIFILFFTRTAILRSPPRHPFSDANVRGSFRSVIPIMGVEALWGVYYLVDGYFASHMIAGSVSIVNYASMVFRLPGLLLGMSIASAFFPDISESVSQNDLRSLRNKFLRVFKLMVIVSIPLTCIVLAYGGELIRLLYERGAFTSSDTMQTTAVLSILAPGFIFLIAYPIIARMLNAFLKNNFLFVSFIVALTTKILLFQFVFSAQGIQGIAFAMLASLTMAFCFPLIVIYRELGKPRGEFVMIGMKICLIAGAAFVFNYFLGKELGVVAAIAGTSLAFPNDLMDLIRTLRMKFAFGVNR